MVSYWRSCKKLQKHVKARKVLWQPLQFCIKSPRGRHLLFSESYLFWILFFTSWEPLNLTAVPPTLGKEKHSIFMENYQRVSFTCKAITLWILAQKWYRQNMSLERTYSFWSTLITKSRGGIFEFLHLPFEGCADMHHNIQPEGQGSQC